MSENLRCTIFVDRDDSGWIVLHTFVGDSSTEFLTDDNSQSHSDFKSAIKDGRKRFKEIKESDSVSELILKVWRVRQSEFEEIKILKK
jgi:hypothetical protein